MVNAPTSRFGEFPDTMEKIKKQKKLYNAYKKLICSVMTLFANADSAGSVTAAPCYGDTSGAANSDTGDFEENPELKSLIDSTRNEGEESLLKKAALDIIEVEAKLADVRMANGVFVLKPSYYHLMWVHKDSHIVERSAVVTWFTDALAQ
ncbi:hypothetical protein HPB50_009268 [Hyalomma asiaticum]|uniref:Uncharacterized protein n=1 Tax=Hyalomma asiaticum TaxID=266040 RepID=A0ACB7RNE0_HYAAI|nr:hypothetical protein HPB50_009268 [Hyalomma asiaticum]